jgi:hypothetical protein
MKYINHNPLKRGYVDEDIHWRYSSTRDYKGGEVFVVLALICIPTEDGWERAKVEIQRQG